VIRFLRDDADQPEDGRTISMLVVGDQIQHTATWSAWDKAKWASAFLLCGLAIGAIATAIADWCMR
jgi:hypothetical protein